MDNTSVYGEEFGGILQFWEQSTARTDFLEHSLYRQRRRSREWKHHEFFDEEPSASSSSSSVVGDEGIGLELEETEDEQPIASSGPRNDIPKLSLIDSPSPPPRKKMISFVSEGTREVGVQTSERLSRPPSRSCAIQTPIWSKRKNQSPSSRGTSPMRRSISVENVRRKKPPFASYGSGNEPLSNMSSKRTFNIMAARKKVPNVFESALKAKERRRQDLAGSFTNLAQHSRVPRTEYQRQFGLRSASCHRRPQK